MDTAQAKQELVDAAQGKGDSTLETFADEVLKRIAMAFGECVGGDSFCGFSVEEERNDQGLLLALKLVACDLVNGEPVRRVAR